MKRKWYAVMLAALVMNSTVMFAQQTEKTNPYAALGHAPYIIGTERESELKNAIFVVENVADGTRLEQSLATGRVRVFDKDGNLIADKQLKANERAWGVPDPKAEKYRNTSPYAYVLNNPMKYIDPTGMKVEGVNYNSKTDEFEFSKRAYKLGTDKIVNAAISTDGGKADLMDIINDKKTYTLVTVEGPMYIETGKGAIGQLEGYVDEAGRTMYISTELDKNTSLEGQVSLIKEFNGEFGTTSSVKTVELNKYTVVSGAANAEYKAALSDSGISEYNRNNPYTSVQEAVHGRFGHEKVHLKMGIQNSVYQTELPAMQNEMKRRIEYNKRYK